MYSIDERETISGNPCWVILDCDGNTYDDYEYLNLFDAEVACYELNKEKEGI